MEAAADMGCDVITIGTGVTGITGDDVLLCRVSAGSYDTCPYWSVWSLDDVTSALIPYAILVSLLYRLCHLLSCILK